MAVTRALPQPPVTGGFARDLEKESGVKLVACFQCQKCSSGCPVAAGADIKPHEVDPPRAARRDATSCCRAASSGSARHAGPARRAARRPSTLPAAIDALRRLSRDARRSPPDTALPLFNDVFLGMVRQMRPRPRAGADGGVQAAHAAFRQDMGKFPMMLRKGKFALLPRVRPRPRRATAHLPSRYEQAKGEAVSYVFYPGCSLESTAKDYALSTKAVAARAGHRHAGAAGLDLLRLDGGAPVGPLCWRWPCRRRTWPPPPEATVAVCLRRLLQPPQAGEP